MAEASFQHADEARAALRAIVADPEHGAAALSSGRTTANLLKDFLPDAPKETAILVAAAENGLAAKLRDFANQGMDAATAIRLTASSFAAATAFTPEACDWAAGELAIALGLAGPGDASLPGAAAGASIPGPQAPVPPASPGYQGQGTPPYQSAAGPPGAPAAGAGQGFQQQPFQGSPQATRDWPGQGAGYQQATAPGPGYGGSAPAAPPGWPTSPPPPGWQTGPPAGPTPGKRRRATVIAIVAGVTAVAAAIAAVAVFALGKSPPAPAKPKTPPVVSIAESSSSSNVNGNVLVYYLDGKYADATISGNISRAASGEVARLTAQQFPFTSSPTVVASSNISGTSKQVSFGVAPSLATRYQIEVFASPSATSPLVRSATQMVYVDLVGISKITRSQCPRPECYVTIRIRVHVPPAAIETESSKHLYFYFGVNLASTKEPAAPTSLTLQQNVTAGASTILGSDQYQQIVAFMFNVGNHAYHWRWDACTLDNESGDGIGLPGHHECGNATIPASGVYLG